MNRVIQNMFVTPENTFPFLQSRPMAFFLLYFLPAFLVLSVFSATIMYEIPWLTVLIVIVAVVYFAALVVKGFQASNDQLSLEHASTEELPDVIIRYFKRQHPVSDLPMFVSADRRHWVAYGHIDKNGMARAMTHLDYHLMPPPPEITDYFIKNTQHIKHQYITIADPQAEEFLLSDTPTDDKPSYPVTVFDRSDN